MALDNKEFSFFSFIRKETFNRKPEPESKEVIVEEDNKTLNETHDTTDYVEPVEEVEVEELEPTEEEDSNTLPFTKSTEETSLEEEESAIEESLEADDTQQEEVVLVVKEEVVDVVEGETPVTPSPAGEISITTLEEETEVSPLEEETEVTSLKEPAKKKHESKKKAKTKKKSKKKSAIDIIEALEKKEDSEPINSIPESTEEIDTNDLFAEIEQSAREAEQKRTIKYTEGDLMCVCNKFYSVYDGHIYDEIKADFLRVFGTKIYDELNITEIGSLLEVCKEILNSSKNVEEYKLYITDIVTILGEKLGMPSLGEDLRESFSFMGEEDLSKLDSIRKRTPLTQRATQYVFEDVLVPLFKDGAL